MFFVIVIYLFYHGVLLLNAPYLSATYSLAPRNSITRLGRFGNIQIENALMDTMGQNAI